MDFCCVESVDLLKTMLNSVENCICALCTAKLALFAAAFCAIFQMLIVCSWIV